MNRLIIGLKIFVAIILNRPFKLTLMASGHCNLRCSMCNIWRNSPSSLTFEQMRSIYEAHRSSVCWINITGGEPTLNPDLEQFLTYLVDQDRYLMISITSNGSLSLEDCLLRLVGKAKKIFWYYYTSLDDFEDLHDRSRGEMGLYAKIVSTHQGKLKKLKSLQMGVSFTLMPQNAERLELILQKLSEISRSININIMRIAPYYQNAKLRSFSLSQEHYRQLLPYIRPFEFEGFLRIIFFRLYLDRLNGSCFAMPCQSTRFNILVDSACEIKDCTLYYQSYSHNNMPLLIDGYRAPSMNVLSQRNQRIEERQCEADCYTPCESYINILVNLFTFRFAPHLLKSYWRGLKDYRESCKELYEQKL